MVSTGLKALTFLPGCGYGDAGTLYVNGLHDLGVPLTWTPLTFGTRSWGAGFDIAPVDVSDSAPWRDGAYDRRLDRVFNRPLAADTLMVQLPFDWWAKARAVHPGMRPVAYTTWETDRLRDDWVAELNRFDQVIVPSTFNERVFRESGVTVPLHVVPHGARPVTPVPGGEFGPVTSDDFVFYTIGEWRTRKALDETVRAYLDAFTADDNVALIVKTSALDHEAHWAMVAGLIGRVPERSLYTSWRLVRLIAEYPRPAKIYLVVDRLTGREIDQLHTRGDCYVSLARGEGWGLGSFDAALFDKPSIITGWSGYFDYLGADHPLLVNFTLGEVEQFAPDGRVIVRDARQRWATADRAHASHLMRWAFDHRDEVRALGTTLGRRVRETYEATAICRQLAASLGFQVS